MLHENGAIIEGFTSICVQGKGQEMQPIHVAAKNGNHRIVQFIAERSDNKDEIIKKETLPTFS